MDADIILPDNLSELIVLESMNSLIPRIKNKIAMSMRRDDQLAKFAKPIFDSLGEIYAQNRVDIMPLDAQWKVWAYRGRDSQTSFNKPTPSGSSLYPGGTIGSNNRWGGGGYGGGY